VNFVRLKNCRCTLCADRVDTKEFRNEIFVNEFENSGPGQGCPDAVFGYKVAWRQIGLQSLNG
jgi:hypothetical protein